MPDMWIAECLPCKFSLEKGTQDLAIKAAVAHRREKHPDVSDTEAAQQFIGHVQLRDVDAIGTLKVPVADAAQSAPASPDPGAQVGGDSSTGTEPQTAQTPQGTQTSS